MAESTLAILQYRSPGITLMFAYNGLRAYYDCVFHPIWSLLPKSTTNARFLYGPISHCHLALLLTEKRRLAHPLRVS